MMNYSTKKKKACNHFEETYCVRFFLYYYTSYLSAFNKLKINFTYKIIFFLAGGTRQLPFLKFLVTQTAPLITSWCSMTGRGSEQRGSAPLLRLARSCLLGGKNGSTDAIKQKQSQKQSCNKVRWMNERKQGKEGIKAIFKNCLQQSKIAHTSTSN